MKLNGFCAARRAEFGRTANIIPRLQLYGEKIGGGFCIAIENISDGREVSEMERLYCGIALRYALRAVATAVVVAASIMKLHCSC